MEYSDFRLDISFSVKDIESMLNEYEQDYQTGMNIWEISQLIYDYTSGYPYLVSRICQIMDERILGTDEFLTNVLVWTRADRRKNNVDGS